MIGSGIAAIVCVATGTTANAIGVGGIPGILSIQPQFMASFGICMTIAFAIPFVLTAVVGKKRLAAGQGEIEGPVKAAAGAGAGPAEAADGTGAGLVEAAAGAGAGLAEAATGAGAGPAAARASAPQDEEGKKTAGTLRAFLSGKAIPLAEVGDGVFSAGILGDGMAIIPESETLYAPADGEVAALMPDSCHACGLRLDNGMEVLLHIGLDTVDMKGDGFRYLVKEGQRISAGTPLIRFDRAKIKAAGHRDVTICVISNRGTAGDIRFHTGIHVEENETTVATFQ